VKFWLLAFRVKTLTAAVVPIIVGTALVKAMGYPILWWVSAYALLSALSIQIATNLFNDAIDFKKGADSDQRLGPARMTQSGSLSFRRVLALGFVFLGLAFLFGLPLVIHGGWPIVLVGVTSLFLAYAYTGGPFPLAYLGLGDLFVILFFGLIAVGGIYYLHTMSFEAAAGVAGLQMGFLCAVLIVINNLRDLEQDRRANKKTLQVRMGAGFGRFELAFLIVTSFLFLNYWWVLGERLAATLPLLLLPLGLLIIRWVYKTPPSAKYNDFLAFSALLHLGFGVLLSLGLILG
jgi:1,4-dihydroxy-2-naphthoate octaprenyltransferase